MANNEDRDKPDDFELQVNQAGNTFSSPMKDSGEEGRDNVRPYAHMPEWMRSASGDTSRVEDVRVARAADYARASLDIKPDVLDRNTLVLNPLPIALVRPVEKTPEPELKIASPPGGNGFMKLNPNIRESEIPIVEKVPSPYAKTNPGAYIEKLPNPELRIVSPPGGTGFEKINPTIREREIPVIEKVPSPYSRSYPGGYIEKTPGPDPKYEIQIGGSGFDKINPTYGEKQTPVFDRVPSPYANKNNPGGYIDRTPDPEFKIVSPPGGTGFREQNSEFYKQNPTINGSGPRISNEIPERNIIQPDTNNLRRVDNSVLDHAGAAPASARNNASIQNVSERPESSVKELRNSQLINLDQRKGSLSDRAGVGATQEIKQLKEIFDKAKTDTKISATESNVALLKKADGWQINSSMVERRNSSSQTASAESSAKSLRDNRENKIAAVTDSSNQIVNVADRRKDWGSLTIQEISKQKEIEARSARRYNDLGWSLSSLSTKENNNKANSVKIESNNISKLSLRSDIQQSAGTLDLNSRNKSVRFVDINLGKNSLIIYRDLNVSLEVRNNIQKIASGAKVNDLISTPKSDVRTSDTKLSERSISNKTSKSIGTSSESTLIAGKSTFTNPSIVKQIDVKDQSNSVRCLDFRCSDMQQSGNRRYITGVELTVMALVNLASIAKANSNKVKEIELIDDGYFPDLKEADLVESNSNLKNHKLSDKQKSDLSCRSESNKEEKASIFKRPSYMVMPGDTLVNIAERIYRDAQVAFLILELNKSFVKECSIEGNQIVELQARQELEMPIASDLRNFYAESRRTLDTSKLITIVNENNIDKELLDNFLGVIVGRRNANANSANIVVQSIA